MSISQKEADRLKDLIQAQVTEPEEEKKFMPKKGQLCHFWDYEDSKFIGKFNGMSDGFYNNERGDGWKHCAPYIAKATKQKWNGGECPVDGDALVTYEVQSGDVSAFRIGTAGNLNWKHGNIHINIIAYWELEQ